MIGLIKKIFGTKNEREIERIRKALVPAVYSHEAVLKGLTDEELRDKSVRVQQLLGHRSYKPVPQTGGGLWLRHVSRIEEQPSVEFGNGK